MLNSQVANPINLMEQDGFQAFSNPIHHHTLKGAIYMDQVS